MPEILLLNGPNLNLLGTREPARYGNVTLAEVEAMVVEEAARHGLGVRAVQSNHEGALVDAVQGAGTDGLVGAVINAGAYTHSSIALRDALLAVRLPFVEIHVSNVFAREPFRHTSMLSDIAVGVICGCGAEGYRYAVSALGGHLARARVAP